MLYATVHPIDKHPDIVASQGTMDLIEACNPSSISLVLEYVRELERKVSTIREECASICERRYMGDNSREDMEARRCAQAIRAIEGKEKTE